MKEVNVIEKILHKHGIEMDFVRRFNSRAIQSTVGNFAQKRGKEQQKKHKPSFLCSSRAQSKAFSRGCVAGGRISAK